uniref:Uncharacterized protein n=1 Tax=Palpitomonas bilix TaxID=652834 RepID=A0A7S3G6D1_9EUKA|mmetsp:Transcript_25240/g.63318  ORF Transcript_25240/g.63318 Transcript_25240/m.63318 type:complete len:118 (+) Transcript_25240:128-481(+)
MIFGVFVRTTFPNVLSFLGGEGRFGVSARRATNSSLSVSSFRALSPSLFPPCPQLLRRFSTPSSRPIQTIAFTADERHLFVGLRDGTVCSFALTPESLYGRIFELIQTAAEGVAQTQ